MERRKKCLFFFSHSLKIPGLTVVLLLHDSQSLLSNYFDRHVLDFTAAAASSLDLYEMLLHGFVAVHT